MAMHATRSRRTSILVLLPGAVDTPITDAATWLRISNPFKLSGAPCYITAKKAPSAGSVSFVLTRSTDNGASFSALATVTLTSGAHYVALTPAWSATALRAGDFVSVNITTGDVDCSGVTIQITEN